jgi:hypothetical protein
MQAEDLLQLTALSSLTHVQLGYRTGLPNMRRSGQVCLDGKLTTVLTQHAARTWGLLPLRHLSIDTALDKWRDPLPLDVMQHIGQLSGLTYLGCNAIVPAGCNTDVCGALLRLKALCELRLDVFFEAAQNAGVAQYNPFYSQFKHSDYSAVRDKVAAATATQQLLQAVSQLPGLVRLSLGGLEWRLWYSISARACCCAGFAALASVGRYLATRVRLSASTVALEKGQVAHQGCAAHHAKMS